jgi:hypothetical protein
MSSDSLCYHYHLQGEVGLQRVARYSHSFELNFVGVVAWWANVNVCEQQRQHMRWITHTLMFSYY